MPLWEKCFPELGTRTMAASPPSIPSEKDHPRATIMEKELDHKFPVTTLPTRKIIHPVLWTFHNACVINLLFFLILVLYLLYLSNKGLNWAHKADIEMFVDVIRMFDLPVSLAKEVSITSLCPDFWVLKHAGIPIGRLLSLLLLLHIFTFFIFKERLKLRIQATRTNQFWTTSW